MQHSRIIHIMAVEKFTDGFVEFINNNFEEKNHDFLVHGRKKYKIDCLKKRNVSYRNDIRLYLSRNSNIQSLLSYDKIIIHGLFGEDLISVWCKNKQLLQKTYIYFYGGDFYPNESKEIKLMSELKKRYVIRNARGIINILPVENDIMERLYHVKGEKYYATYYDEDVIKYYLESSNKEAPQSDVIRIQVGNSATPTNNHKEVLDVLYKFKNENIIVYAPLSYGDSDYADEVSRYGKRLLGNKFVPIRNYMNKEDYYDFMKNVDIAIFNVSRQQALGNIYAHIAYQNIIYLRKKSVGTYYLRKILSCKIRYIEDIGKMSFDQFISQKLEIKQRNAENLLHRLKEDTVIKEWEQIFQ